MEDVGHEVLVHRAISIQKGRIDVEPEDIFVVDQLARHLRSLVQDVAAGVHVGPLAEGETPDQEDLCGWQLFSQQHHDRPDSACNLDFVVRGREVFGVGIVGANHERRDLGTLVVQFAVLQIPEDVFGSAAAVSQVNRVARREIFVPKRLIGGVLELVSDRVADQQKIVLVLPNHLDLFGMPLLPARLRNRNLGRVGDFGLSQNGVGGEEHCERHADSIVDFAPIPQLPDRLGDNSKE